MQSILADDNISLEDESEVFKAAYRWWIHNGDINVFNAVRSVRREGQRERERERDRGGVCRYERDGINMIDNNTLTRYVALLQTWVLPDTSTILIGDKKLNLKRMK